MQSVKHPNIIAVMDSYQTKKGKQQQLNIVMEFAPEGTLEAKIKKLSQVAKDRILNDYGTRLYLPEELVLRWFKNLCDALKYLHDRELVHGNIKSWNVLLGDDQIKLSEYRLQHFVPYRATKNFVKDSAYLAPEIMGSSFYTKQSDVWALGVLLYEMCALCRPFDANGLLKLQNK
jgi:NIMA (never in mitosis gene a)-related kinase 1/4/5